MKNEDGLRLKRKQMNRIKRRMRWKMRRKRILTFFKRIILSVFTSSMAAIILIPAAMAERVYPAIGGEWCGILFSGYIVFLVSKKIEKEKE